MNSVALIGFGEAGSIFARDLKARGAGRLTAFDPLFAKAGSPAARSLAKANGVQACASAQEAVQGAELVFIAVTAGSDIEAATSIGDLGRGPYVVDVNSVSPGVKRQAASIVERAGGRYVEAAVMSSIPPKGLATPMLLGGPDAEQFMPLALDLGMDARVFSPEIGRASSVKMCRSVIIKGLESLLMESLLASRSYGVETEMLASLTDTLPGADWRRLATYMIGRSLQHGGRRAEEMQEVARTIAEAGLEPVLATAIAEKQAWAGRIGLEVGDAMRASEGLEALVDIALSQARRSAKEDQ